MKKQNFVRTIILGGSLLLQLSTLCFHSHGAAGDVDLSFDPGSGVNGRVSIVAVQPDGKVLIGGQFNTVNGTDRNGIARLNANGILDTSFDPYIDGGWIMSFVVQSDGKVLVAGAFSSVSGTNRNSLARLNADGSLDNSFQPDLAAFIHPEDCGGYSCQQWTEAIAVLVQADGKVLIGGYTVTLRVIDPDGDTDSVVRSFFARFNANGSLDSNYNAGAGIIEAWVNSMVLQPDGKVFVAGSFPVHGTSRGIARLNSNGSLDNTFNPAVGGYPIALQADGKVLFAGSFTVNGTNRYGVARLNAGGSLDSTFNPTMGANDTVRSLAVQPDGKVLIGGMLYSINSTNPNTVARLNADGSLDTNFHNPITGALGNSHVMAIALQPDGNVLIVGDFTIVNGEARPRVARLYGDSFAPSLNIARSNALVIVSWPVTGLNFQLQESTDLALRNSWSPVTQSAVTNVGQITVSFPTTVGRKFLRLKLQ